jgi:tetratricopeptide (TPR) repeat protein
VSDLVTARPAVCLNMIVRNEAHMRDDAHIIQKTLDSVAPFISSWVIVDTGSDDGTQELIRSHMARLGIPGKLFERPWRDFGHNRTEALDLAKGHGDYIWVIDADDILVGTADFSQLSADAYTLRYRQADQTGWRTQLFRDGLRWRYEGVVHETPLCDDPYVAMRLEGEYHIEYRRLGTRGQDPQKYAADADLLLAEVERNPEDLRSVILLAQSYFDQGDFANARTWYARRLGMGTLRSTEEVFIAMHRLAESMHKLDEPWPDVQDAYLKAWAVRPTRAEPLYAIAFQYRFTKQYRLGYQFAQRAAEIPFPVDDLMVRADVYAWRATDEQAVCASWMSKHVEAFTLWRRLLARPDIPDHDRGRIAGHRDICVPAMIEAASSYPEVLAGNLVAGPHDAKVTVSLLAGPDKGATEQTLNSFLNCCTDVSRVGRFLVVYVGMSALDRARLRERAMLRKRYGFVEFVDCGPAEGPDAQLGQIREQIHGRFWLHLGEGWRFFAPENLITRLTAVLDAEPQVFQVGINVGDAVKLTGACAAEKTVRRTPDAGRYVLTDLVARGPAMFDTARLDQAGGVEGNDCDPVAEVGRRAAAGRLRTATLDEVLCQGPSARTATTVAEVIAPTTSSPPRIHRFCIAHVEPLIPESWYDDCIALGSFRSDSVSHVSQLDPFWHEARPVAYGAAGSHALPIAIERFAIAAELIEITWHRKRILPCPVGIVSPILPGARELSIEEAAEMPELSVFTPPNDAGFLLIHPTYFENSIIGQYAAHHELIDLLDYTSIAIELGVLDDRSAAAFFTMKQFIPGGVEYGIFPKSFLISALSQIEHVGREFLFRHANRLKTYNKYQIRAVHFLSERLGSYMLIRHLTEMFANNIPADIFGYLTCIVESGSHYTYGVAD